MPKRRPPTTSTLPTLLVIPAHNEAASLPSLWQALRKLDLDCVVVADASTDGSVAWARDAGLLVLDVAVQLGAWGATQAGLRYAVRQGYQRVVTLDGDGQHDPASLPDMLAEHDCSGADVVIGTFPQRLSRGRKLAWSWFRSLTGLKIEDLTSGFRVYGRRALSVLTSDEATLLDYQDVGVLLLLRKYRLTVVETPALMHPRQQGRSKVFGSWLLVVRYMIQTTVLCIARIGRFRVAAMPLEEPI